MAIRRRRRSDDPFFTNGDKTSLRDAETVIFFYLEDEEEEDADTLHTPYTDENISNDDARGIRLLRITYPCSVPQCKAVFDTSDECEYHFWNFHAFECGECGAVLPNEYLLDLHLQEAHDSYFQSAVEKNRAHYQCLSSSCPLTFPTDYDRTLHLRSVHGYPKWFRFHPRSSKSLDGMTVVRGKNYGDANNGVEGSSSSSSSEWERKKWFWSKTRSRYSTTNPVQDKMVRTSTFIDAGDNIETRSGTIEERPLHVPKEGATAATATATVNQNSTKTIPLMHRKKQERKERKKRTNATIPCKFYNTDGGCWRGERCMFLHSDSCIPSRTNSKRIHSNEETALEADGNNNNNNNSSSSSSNMEVDVMEDLTNCVQTKARISVPDNISFGRRRGFRF